jgi:aminoglycoside phosphotransferase (APT) family kinase protein
MIPPTLTDHMPAGKPEAEIEVDENLVRRLLESQHPELNHLPLAHLDSGWDNILFRLGTDYVVRVPRRLIAADLMRNEQIWLPKLAPVLPIDISAPIHPGEPTEFYPWHWSVLPWFAGRCADEVVTDENQAELMAEFLLALHRLAPQDAPTNPVRGVPIRVREANTLERMARVRAKTDLVTPAIEATWNAALSAPEANERRWLHGDLHAQNVLVTENGELSAVIDWGDLNGGDVATDLAGFWALFDSADARATAVDAYRPDSDLLCRARGWAVVFGVVLVDSGLINSPRHAAAGRKILERLSADLSTIA